MLLAKLNKYSKRTKKGRLLSVYRDSLREDEKILEIDSVRVTRPHCTL